MKNLIALALLAAVVMTAGLGCGGGDTAKKPDTSKPAPADKPKTP